MSATNVYQPGVCNIGPAEIRQRRLLGLAGAGVAVVFLAVAFALGLPPALRLLAFVPAALGANGLLQAAWHFCVGFAARGLFNFGEVGTQEAVHEAEYRRADQRTAVKIVVISTLIGLVVAVGAFLVPLP